MLLRLQPPCKGQKVEKVARRKVMAESGARFSLPQQLFMSILGIETGD
jgi:hypothetical protein